MVAEFSFAWLETFPPGNLRSNERLAACWGIRTAQSPEPLLAAVQEIHARPWLGPFKAAVLSFKRLGRLPRSALLPTFFGWEGSPTKIIRRPEKSWCPYFDHSNLEDLVGVCLLFVLYLFFFFRPPVPLKGSHSILGRRGKEIHGLHGGGAAERNRAGHDRRLGIQTRRDHLSLVFWWFEGTPKGEGSLKSVREEFYHRDMAK